MTALYLKLLPCSAILSLLWIGGSSQADEQPAPAKETRIVLRISKEFIRRHAPPAITEVSPINRCMFGAHVTGQSNTSGQIQIEMVPHDRDAVFTLRFSGTTTTKTVATRNPVEVYESGKTVFEAQRKITFNGLRFSEGPITIKTSYSSSFDGLATPRGLRGLIARKVAIARVARTQPQSDAIGLQDTTNQVVAGFNKATEELLKDLNKMVPIDQTINLFIPKTKDWIYHLGSTKDYIFASPGPKDAKIPVLPKEAARMSSAGRIMVPRQARR